MWLLGILQHAAAATDIGASADQQTIDNQITAKNHRYPNTGVPQYLYRPRQVDGVVLQLLAAWLSVTHQSSRPSIRSTVRPVLRDANAALTAVWISLTRTETNTTKNLKRIQNEMKWSQWRCYGCSRPTTRKLCEFKHTTFYRRRCSCKACMTTHRMTVT